MIENLIVINPDIVSYKIEEKEIMQQFFCVMKEILNRKEKQVFCLKIKGYTKKEIKQELNFGIEEILNSIKSKIRRYVKINKNNTRIMQIASIIERGFC